MIEATMQEGAQRDPYQANLRSGPDAPGAQPVAHESIYNLNNPDDS
jgi:hypothetical protein